MGDKYVYFDTKEVVATNEIEVAIEELENDRVEWEATQYQRDRADEYSKLNQDELRMVTDNRIKHRVAKGIILWYMKHCGFYGWTSYWNTIYYRTEKHRATKTLRKHELKHIEQINRMGRIVFTFKYIYYDWKYGYDENPLEIEAREAERKN